jgi:phospholipase A-2-activating protein
LAASASADAKTPARLALATAILNMSTCVHTSTVAGECAAQAVSAGSELLLSCPAADDDCRFRASLASDLGLADVAEALRVSGGTERTREAAGDLKLAMSR